jgi:hypothetical protein
MRRRARHVLEQVLELAGRRYASQARHVADESATSGVRRRTSIAVASPLASVHGLSRRFACAAKMRSCTSIKARSIWWIELSSNRAVSD